MRFRLVEPRDFPTCRSLLNPALRLSRRVLDRLPTLWRALALFGTFSIVEDPITPYPDSIQGFGASVFVADQFVDEFLAAGRNYLDAALYEAVMDGPSPVLSDVARGGGCVCRSLMRSVACDAREAGTTPEQLQVLAATDPIHTNRPRTRPVVRSLGSLAAKVNPS